MFTFSLQFKDKKDLNKFFAELKSKISSDWTLKLIDNKVKRSFLNYKAYALSVCFKTVIHGDEIIAIGIVELGLFETYIKIIDVRIGAALNKRKEKIIQIDEDEDFIKTILSLFYNAVINPLNSKELLVNKNIEFKYDLSHELKDLRMPRPQYFKEMESGKIASLNRLELNEIGNQYFNFTPPNNIALLLNVSKNELEISKKLFKNFISKKFNANKNSYLKEVDLPDVYDYLEHIQISIIFAYSAVESFANTAIPFDYKFEKTNGKGVLEIWNKENIELYFKTSEKLKVLLPKILNIEEPTKLSFWSKFTELEKYRNDIIHPKHTTPTSINCNKNLLTQNVFQDIYSAYEIIEYFCNADTKHTFFPIGISNSDINIIEVEKFSDSISHLEWNFDNSLIETKF